MGWRRRSDHLREGVREKRRAVQREDTTVTQDKAAAATRAPVILLARDEANPTTA